MQALSVELAKIAVILQEQEVELIAILGSETLLAALMQLQLRPFEVEVEQLHYCLSDKFWQLGCI